MKANTLYTPCMEGHLEEIKMLLKSGANPDGDDDSEDWYDKGIRMKNPKNRPLQTAARNGHLKICQLLLDAGAQINLIVASDKTALIEAAGHWFHKIVKLLIDRGADVNFTGRRGNALAQACDGISSTIDPNYDNLEKTVKILLENGASPTVRTQSGKNAIDVLLGFIDREHRFSTKELQNVIEMLKIILPYAGEEKSRIEEVLAKNIVPEMKKMIKLSPVKAKRLGLPEEIKSADWPEKIRKIIGPVDECRANLEKLCKYTLSVPEVIEHPEWPAFIKEVIDQTADYSDLTEDIFGERYTVDQMDEDESGILEMIGDDKLYTVDIVLKILAKKQAVEHPQWAELLKHLCDTKEKRLGYMSFGDNEINFLLKEPFVQEHKAFKDVARIARNAFPFANCFGARGFLRNLK